MPKYEVKEIDGRPSSKARTIFTEEDIAIIEEKAAIMSLQEIADFFGIDQRTLFDIRARQEEVDIAYRKGKAKAHAMVGGKILKMCEEGNVPLLTLYAKTRMGWSERSLVEFSDNENSPKIFVKFAEESKALEDAIKTKIENTRKRSKKVKDEEENS